MNLKLLAAAASGALSIGLLAAPAQAATVYDAVTDFSSVSSVGTWSYGSIEGGVFTPFTRNDACFADLSCWQQSPDLTVAEVPTVIKNVKGSTNTYATVTQPTDVLNLHPGQNLGEDTIVRFTAPSAGTYDLRGFFEILDSHPTGVLVSLNGRGLGPVTFALPGLGNMVSFSAPLHLLAADQVDFRVNNAGLFFNDSTGLSATLTAVPEPASWALMIMGFGTAGAMLRRRRAALPAA